MKLIDKDVLVAEINSRININETCQKISGGHEFYRGVIDEAKEILSFIDSIEVKDMGEPALDNGNMPVERWKEACEAASCQANYRNSKELTETCDDYFVDGVQWADEHPMKVKEVDLEKEIDTWYQNEASKEFENVFYNDIENCAKHFFELGLKARTDKELVEEVYSHIDSIKDTADRMTSGNFMHSKAAIKFSANTIAKVLELMGLKAQKGEVV